MAFPDMSFTTGKSFSDISASNSPTSEIPPISAIRAITRIPSFASSCRQMPPAMQSGAVIRPEKAPPPALSQAAPYFTAAV